MMVNGYLVKHCRGKRGDFDQCIVLRRIFIQMLLKNKKMQIGPNMLLVAQEITQCRM